MNTIHIMNTRLSNGTVKWTLGGPSAQVTTYADAWTTEESQAACSRLVASYRDRLKADRQAPHVAAARTFCPYVNV